jgi:uncharacterized membrane protein YagU involved in acid resistance
VFQYIASGLIRAQSFRMGWASVVLGVILHYTIALIWTAIFYLAARRVPIIMRRSILSGLIYGGLVYSIMNFIVLPLSGVPHTRNAITLASRINAVLALLVCIGLPISLLVRRTLLQRRN